MSVSYEASCRRFARFINKTNYIYIQLCTNSIIPALVPTVTPDVRTVDITVITDNTIII